MTNSNLRPDDRAPNLLVGDDVQIEAGAVIGANVVIEGATRIAAGAHVQHGAILGRMPTLGPRSSASSSAESLPPLVVESGAVICPGAIVFAGALIREHAIVGDQSHVRERATLGASSVLGRGGALGTGVRVGARVRIQSMVWLTGGTIVEDDVFIGPGVMTMNDNEMGRRPPGEPHLAPHFCRACRVGGGVLVTPGIRVGEEAFVASGAVLTADVVPRAKVMGVPARDFGRVGDDELIGRWF